MFPFQIKYKTRMQSHDRSHLDLRLEEGRNLELGPTCGEYSDKIMMVYLRREQCMMCNQDQGVGNIVKYIIELREMASLV